jgi:hypothetical protein
VGDEAVNFLNALQMHRDSARLAVAKAQHKQAQQYNCRRCAVPELKKGSCVLINPHSLEWMEAKGSGAKLSQRWIGPFEVMQRINPKVYWLCMSEKYPSLPIFNIDHFKKYKESPAEFPDHTVMPETRSQKPAATEYIVEKIIAHKYDKKGSGIKYLIRWEGYGPQFNTWETCSHLKNAPQIVSKYRRLHNL